MTAQEREEIAGSYRVRYGPEAFADLAQPPVIFEPGFWDLLKAALERGRPLTREEVEAAFPGSGYEEIEE